jgi:hypothetical protein
MAAAETDAERERLRHITKTPTGSMVGVVAELERRHGGVRAFLREGVLRDEDLELAGDRLR